jgi:hypothetical protein
MAAAVGTARAMELVGAGLLVVAIAGSASPLARSRDA